jgi:hypothetical protein
VKSYPSIPKGIGSEGVLHTFDKLDGSNLRFEWTKKRGWFKFGTRKRLFDVTDPVFGEAIPLFHERLADPLEEIIVTQGWSKVVVFAEFWGARSFAGLHEPDDPKFLTVIDVSPHQKGILDPKEFVKLFGKYGPRYFGAVAWNQPYIALVKSGTITGISFEGVVGKAVRNKKMVMFKAKTQAWIDKVKRKYDEQKAKEIIES